MQQYSADEYPTIISFAAGDAYYHEKAQELARRCDELGLHHSIDHITDMEDVDWAQLCRFKIQFYRKKMEELNRPILWLDADSVLLQRPEALRNSNADFGSLFKSSYIKEFDPYKTARIWSSAVLYFGPTPVTKRFLDHLCQVEAASPVNITDDYALQEAWTSFEEQMFIMLLPPKIQALTPAKVTDDSWLLHGHSGNVADYKGKVLQHSSLKNPGSILCDAAADAIKDGQFELAETLLNASDRYDYDSIAKAKRLSIALLKLGRPDEGRLAIRSFHERNPDNIEGKISFGKQMMKDKKFTTAERLFKEAESSQDPKFSGLATALLFDLRQERKAKRMKLEPADRPRVWWMKQPYPGNLGDILNPYIVEKLTGIPPRFAPQGKGMLAIGSVIKFAKDGCDVWGTGTPRMTDELNPKAKYHAVRGPLTRQLVIESGGECPEVYGDAALLMPYLYSPTIQKKYKLGVIRHVRQRTLGTLSSEVADLNLLRVGYEEIEKFIDELLECEMVISTSLHGIILANAYGIPARWAEFSETHLQIQGDGTKYIDYFRSVGLPDQVPLDLSKFDILDESLVQYVDPNCEIEFDARALLDAFPGELKKT